MLINKIFKLAFFTIFINVLLTFSSYSNESSGSHISYGVSVFNKLKYSENFKHFDYVNPKATKAGRMKLASIGSFDSLNPFSIKGMPPEAINLTFDTLMSPSADEKLAAYPLIAEKVEISKDKDWVIFYINHKARWNDGTPITSDDVVFSLESMKKKSHPFYRTYYMDIKKAEKLDKYRVKIIFSKNNNREILFIASQLPILPKAYFKDKDFSKSLVEPILGSGPYTVKKFDLGHSISYERNDNYWAKDLPVNIGRYNFNFIQIDYYRDVSIAIEAFKAGEYDFRSENISKLWSKAYDIPEVKDGRIIKETIPNNSPKGMQCFVLNTRRPSFQNRKFREALNYAYDFEWANKKLFYSLYSRNKSFFGDSEFASSGLPSKEELDLLNPFKDILPSRLFTSEYKLPTTDGNENIRDNLIKASKILKEAGFFLKDMKLFDPKTGLQVKIEFVLKSGFFERIIAAYIKNLKKLGIDANIKTVSPSQYIELREDFNYDVIISWFTQKLYPGNEQFDYWYSKKAEQKGSRNYVGVKNKAVDNMVERIISAKTEKELLNASRALDRILLWNFYVVPQWHSGNYRIIYWNKFKKPKITSLYSLSVIDTWWLKD